jgi:hypothetical protein
MTTTVTPIHTHEQVCALAAAVRDGGLSPEQHEQLARLPHRIDSTYGLAPLAAYSELLAQAHRLTCAGRLPRGRCVPSRRHEATEKYPNNHGNVF